MNCKHSSECVEDRPGLLTTEFVFTQVISTGTTCAGVSLCKRLCIDEASSVCVCVCVCVCACACACASILCACMCKHIEVIMRA